MVSHSMITLSWMLCALGFKWLPGLKSNAWRMLVLGWTGFIIGVWYSREQYWVPTLIYMFVPTQKNMDFILPAVIAVVMAAAFVLLTDRPRNGPTRAP